MHTLLARYDLNWKMGATIMTKRRFVHLLIAFEIVLLILMIAMIGGAN